MSNFSNYQPGLTLPIVSFVMNTETTVTVVFAKYYNTVTLGQKYYNIVPEISCCCKKYRNTVILLDCVKETTTVVFHLWLQKVLVVSLGQSVI